MLTVGPTGPLKVAGPLGICPPAPSRRAWQPATPIVIVPLGNSRWGAAANDTGACHLAHIEGVGHVPQNVRLYVFFLHN